MFFCEVQGMYASGMLCENEATNNLLNLWGQVLNPEWKASFLYIRVG